MYLMTCTRPDLAYPLSLLARYMAPGRHQKGHRDAAKRVLRYLCSTSGLHLQPWFRLCFVAVYAVVVTGDIFDVPYGPICETIYGYSEQQQPLLLEVICKGRRLQAMVDSGASHLVCDRATLEKIGEPSKGTKFTATMVDGTKLPIYGEASMQLHIGALRWKPTLPITNIKGFDFILGRDFLKRFNPEIDRVNRKA
ncbi:unnamed protein product [Closterium sp. NIES-53]